MKAPMPWQTEAWQRLQAQRRADRLSHALLIHGPAGTGKGLLARALAHSLLCREPSPQGEPCGRCRDCTLIAAGNHPDLMEVMPEEGSRQIRIDAIRALVEADTLAVEPGRARIFIVEPAERMGTAAANALLKTLEEPVPGTHMLLVSHNPDRLPITIRSRCRPLNFRVPPAGEAAAWLRQAVGLDDERARLLLELAGGGPVKVLEWLDSGTDALHDRCLEGFLDVARGGAEPSAVAEAWLKEADLAFLLGLLGTWLTALVRAAAAAERAGPLGVRLAGAVSVPDPGNLYRLLDKLFESQRRLSHNPNPQLVLEALLVEWRRITGR